MTDAVTDRAVAVPPAAPDRDADGGSQGSTSRRDGVRWWQWLALVVGWAVIVFSLRGLLVDSAMTNPPAMFRLLIGLNVVNDAIVIPVAIALGVAARRMLPRWLLVPVEAGLIASAIIAVYAFPFVSGKGRTAAAGPSLLPLNYAHGLLVVLAVIWGACLVVAAWTFRRRARPGKAQREGERTDSRPRGTERTVE